MSDKIFSFSGQTVNNAHLLGKAYIGSMRDKDTKEVAFRMYKDIRTGKIHFHWLNKELYEESKENPIFTHSCNDEGESIVEGLKYLEVKGKDDE